MARLSTKYDSDLKEQVFVLRGDESYARTTKTLLTLGATTINTNDFSLSVTVNVLRDRDEGTIHIYDNDVLLYTINDWSSQSNARTVTLNGLAFDITHNIVARYMGNNKCNPSHSTTETINVKDTRRTESILDVGAVATQISENAEFTRTLKISNEVSEAYNEGQELEVWYEGNQITVDPTDENGETTLTIPNVGNTWGLHPVTVKFDGNEHLTSSEKEIHLMIGYDFNITEYPNFIINGEQVTIKAEILNWVGTIRTSSKYPAYLVLYNEGVEVQRLEMTGHTTRTTSFLPIGIEIDSFCIATIHNEREYDSEVIPVTCITPQELILDSTTPRLYKNESNTIQVHTVLPYKGIPVTMSFDDPYAEGTRLYTDNNGVARLGVQGKGVGSKTYTATLGRVTGSLTLEDYTQYWSPAGIHNRDYKTGDYARIYDLNNYFRIDSDSNNVGYLLVPISTNKNYELNITNITSTNTIEIGFGYANSATDYYRTNRSLITQFTNGEITLVKRDSSINIELKNGSESETSSISFGSVSPQYIGIFIRNTGSNPIQVAFTKLTLQELE